MDYSEMDAHELKRLYEEHGKEIGNLLDDERLLKLLDEEAMNEEPLNYECRSRPTINDVLDYAMVAVLISLIIFLAVFTLWLLGIIPGIQC